MSKFKILSIDAGGVKGYFTAYILDQLSKDYNLDILKEFDFFAGCSIGAIIVSCLVKKYSTDFIFKKLENFNIFKMKNEEELGNISLKKIYSFFSIKQKVINDSLKIFGTEKLNSSYIETKKQLLILTTNFRTKEVVKITNYGDNSNLNFANAVRRSYSMPFVNLEKEEGQWYVDPSNWVSNPSLVAIFELIKEKKITVNDVKLLSFGHRPNVENFNLNKNFLFEFSKLSTRNEFNSISIDKTISEILSPKDYLRITPPSISEEAGFFKISNKFKEDVKKFYKNNREKIYKFIISK